MLLFPIILGRILVVFFIIYQLELAKTSAGNMIFSGVFEDNGYFSGIPKISTVPNFGLQKQLFSYFLLFAYFRTVLIFGPAYFRNFTVVGEKLMLSVEVALHAHVAN